LGGYNASSTVNAVSVVGNHAHIATNGATGNEMLSMEYRILQLPGIETPTMYAGALESATLIVNESARVNNSLYIGNGLNVGGGGVQLRGPLSVQSTSTGSLYTGLDIKNLSGTTMFSVRDDGFADALRGVTNTNGYIGQEFNDEKAAVTTDQTTWGDEGTWIADVSATTCTFRVNEDYPTASRQQITAAGIGCNMYQGIAAGDPLNYVNATGSLVRFLAKVRLDNTTNTRTYVGLLGTVAANNTTEPTEGIYFTNSGSTVWTGTINGATGQSTYIRCPAVEGAVQTGRAQYALLDITLDPGGRVRFRVDPDTSNGINFVQCGVSSASLVKSNLGIGALLSTITGFSGTAGLNVDYIRVWIAH
jgi:hypothetical protein